MDSGLKRSGTGSSQIGTPMNYRPVYGVWFGDFRDEKQEQIRVMAIMILSPLEALQL
jgi:hypothetical protein